MLTLRPHLVVSRLHGYYAEVPGHLAPDFFSILFLFFFFLFRPTDPKSENAFDKKRKKKRGWPYPGFCSMKRLEVFLLPLDGMLVHRRSLPRNFARFPQQFAGTHLYTWVERGTVRVKCLAQEHNIMSPARARTRTARSGVERTNHETTAPPTNHQRSYIIFRIASIIALNFSAVQSAKRERKMTKILILQR